MLVFVEWFYEKAAHARRLSAKREAMIGAAITGTLLVIGAGIFVATQAGSGVEWDYLESFYFCFVTVTSASPPPPPSLPLLLLGVQRCARCAMRARCLALHVAACAAR